MDFAVQADHRVKIKTKEETNKDLDLSKELKKLLNMKVTVIPLLDGELGIVPKGLEKRLMEPEI